MQPPYDNYFMQRYLNGDCSEQERKDFEHWLQHPGIGEQDTHMQQVWQEIASRYPDFHQAEDRILQQLLAKIDQSASSIRLQSQRPISSIWNRFPFLKYAAILLLLLLPFWLINEFQTDTTANSQEIATITKTTKEAQRLTFMLEDGTKITLNTNSTLTYPQHFSESSRQVILTGEAYFEVAKDAARPFTVFSGNVSTLAVGTAFNIKSDPVTHKINVSLTEGKVRVNNSKKGKGEFSLYLQPGEELAYDTKEKSFTKERFNIQERTAWKDGVLYFGGDDIDTIVKKLGKWYGVRIEVKNRPREDWYFEGSFTNQSLENVLKGMSYSKGFDFTINDQQVILNF